MVIESARSDDSELTKETLASLCELASTEKDKRLLKYAACSEMSVEQARK